MRSPPDAARDERWREDHARGLPTRTIARRAGVTVRAIQLGVARARRGAPADGAAGGPRLVPLFPVGTFTPKSACPHRGPIRPGSRLCCMICSRSGLDGHPALARDPRTDPRREPKAPAVVDPGKAAATETRRQRRKRLFAAGPQRTDMDREQ